MNISSKFSNNHALITVTGEIDTLNAEKLLGELEALLKDAQNIDFDLEAVSYISSAGIRTLLTAAKMAEKRGGTLAVVKASEFVREILTMVGLDKALMNNPV